MAMAGLATFQCRGESIRPASEPKVFAHYMPWFRAEKTNAGDFIWEHWQWYGKGPKHDPDDILKNGHRDIASVYYPLTGPYDERDPAILEYQMLTAKAAGIDGFIADWYGPENYTDKVFAGMVKAAERYGFTVAVCLEEKSFFPPYSAAKTRAELKDEMARQIRHVLDRYAPSKAYLHYGGHPVFLVFAGYGEGPLGPNTFSPEELTDVLGRFKEDKILYVRGSIGNEPAGAAAGCYIWSADGRPRDARESYYTTARAARERGEVEYWMGGSCPGFNDTGVWGWGQAPRITDRRGTKLYEEHWDEVLRYRPDAVQITTWNDLEEGTTIEPTEEYGFSFIDLTEQYVERYTGRGANLEDNQWPYRIYKLRRAIESVQDAAQREDSARRLDSFVNSFARGRRFFMGWELKRLEQRITRLTSAPQRSTTGGTTE
jgi:hypothetical protein